MGNTFKSRNYNLVTGSNVTLRIRKIGQATMSARRMPRRQRPMKDGASTEMPRGVASRHRSVDLRMGQPTIGNAMVSLSEHIG